jgi:hypothetical protein
MLFGTWLFLAVVLGLAGLPLHSHVPRTPFALVFALLVGTALTMALIHGVHEPIVARFSGGTEVAPLLSNKVFWCTWVPAVGALFFSVW